MIAVRSARWERDDLAPGRSEIGSAGGGFRALAIHERCWAGHLDFPLELNRPHSGCYIICFSDRSILISIIEIVSTHFLLSILLSFREVPP